MKESWTLPAASTIRKKGAKERSSWPRITKFSETTRPEVEEDQAIDGGGRRDLVMSLAVRFGLVHSGGSCVAPLSMPHCLGPETNDYCGAYLRVIVSSEQEPKLPAPNFQVPREPVLGPLRCSGCPICPAINPPMCCYDFTLCLE
uniref:HDC09850 n=1 Tax=Drosophila melanogaster TaxID=7227 RepID=Q6ILB8_DROME|nr:TPA_inf: HDC09850 [Drosophila melanogaster]